MTRRVRIGLVGFGYWARLSYTPLLAERDDVAVVSACARTEASRAAARDAHGGGLRLHPGYAELIAVGGIDAVMIGLPPSLNAAAAAAALDAGIHAFVEPPFADAGDAERMLSAAEAGRAVLHADVEPRYLPAMGALRELFAGGGELGPLRSVRLDHRMMLAAEYRRSSMLFGLGPWYVDLLDSLIESPAAEVGLRPGKVRPDGLMVSGEARIRYESGAEGTWAFGFEGPETLVLGIAASGDGGEARADLTMGLVRGRRAGGEWTSEIVDCTRPEAGYIGMRESLGCFLAAVRGEGRTMSGPDAIRRTQPVLVKLRELEAGRGG